MYAAMIDSQEYIYFVAIFFSFVRKIIAKNDDKVYKLFYSLYMPLFDGRRKMDVEKEKRRKI